MTSTPKTLFIVARPFVPVEDIYETYTAATGADYRVGVQQGVAFAWTPSREELEHHAPRFEAQGNVELAIACREAAEGNVGALVTAAFAITAYQQGIVIV